MAKIALRNVSVEFPIYNVSARSLKNQFLRLATGGAVVKDANQHVVVRALNNISVTFEHGDRVGLIGHNGAGKSTMLRLLAGIYEPNKGDILVDGSVSPLLDIMQGIEGELSGYENITVRGTLLGLTTNEIEKRARDIAELTGLGDYLMMPTRTYSSGMMLRLAFAISASIKPDILLIDEVFGVGDADFIEKARLKMISLLDQSSVVVMANHSDDVIKEFCNKVLYLDGGKIKYFGAVAEGLQYYHGEKTEGVHC